MTPTEPRANDVREGLPQPAGAPEAVTNTPPKKRKKKSREEIQQEIDTLLAEAYPRRFSLRAALIGMTLLCVVIAFCSAVGMGKQGYVFWGGMLVSVTLSERIFSWRRIGDRIFHWGPSRMPRT